MNPAKLAIDIRIASMTSTDELLNARAVGEDWRSATLLSYRALDEVLDLASAPYRPAVWPRGSEPR